MGGEWAGTPALDAGVLIFLFLIIFDNWIGKKDWLRIIFEIEKDLNGIFDRESVLITDFLAWLKEALKHTSIIVVEGNL